MIESQDLVSNQSIDQGELIKVCKAFIGKTKKHEFKVHSSPENLLAKDLREVGTSLGHNMAIITRKAFRVFFVLTAKSSIIYYPQLF